MVNLGNYFRVQNDISLSSNKMDIHITYIIIVLVAQHILVQFAPSSGDRSHLYDKHSNATSNGYNKNFVSNNIALCLIH